jgi:fructan beta-fructosidase
MKHTQSGKHGVARMAGVVLAGLMVVAARADQTGDLVIADFEGATYGAWKTEGTAFGTGPAEGTLPTQMEVTGFLGKGLVNSFLGGDAAKGTLSSPEITIERDYIKFLVGGGGHIGKTCINLIVDGKVVRSETGPNLEPGGSEFLNWAGWDVKELKGKKVLIHIVDDKDGGWGHINVDQIVQSNEAAKKLPLPPGARPGPAVQNVKEIKITGRYLIFPVINDGPRVWLTVHVGAQLVHKIECNFAARTDKIDWWGWLDLSEYVGQSAKIATVATAEIFSSIESASEIRHLQPLYDEALRPQFHFSQMRGWNNDPNGMCYYDGLYHLFWQSNPAGFKWGNMYWGHATSPDMVHWAEQAHALRPNGGNAARHPSMACGQCWSGSGNIDEDNTAGWQKGKDKTMVTVFTDTGCGEALAYSTDHGQSWTNYEKNPIIQHNGRDPKLIWYEPGKHWVIAVFDERAPHGKNISIYTSKNLKNWEYASSLPGYYECAELVELPVDGNAANKKWVVFAADAKYAIGQFDGKKFMPEHEGKHQVHWGLYYASQCFSRAPGGRVLQIGWATIDMPGMPFNQTFSVPTELTLRTTEDGIRMFAAPIRELEALRKRDPQTVARKELTAETPAVAMDAADQLYDIVVTLKRGTASKAILRFGACAVTYDFGAGKLDEMPLKMKDGVVSFRVLVDRPMYEVIGGEGACFKTSGRDDKGKPLGRITLTAEGGALTVESLTAHELRSAWRK